MVDAREELELTPKPMESHGKARFLIRTLPKTCNPTPVPRPGSSGGRTGQWNDSTAVSSSMASPASRKHSLDDAIHMQDNPFDDITEEKLQQLSGHTDLSSVKYLQLSIDSGKQSVEAIGELLPSLQQLRLQNSVLHSFRDLGTSLHSLQILWIMRSGIKDLDGIGALTGLQELYLQYNDISDISPLTMHEELQVLDLEGNSITDIGQVEQLAFCPQLISLNLHANPVCTILQYRQIVANFVPQLETLDDKAITEEDRSKISDDAIDAAIRAHQEAQLSATTSMDDHLLIADGIKSSNASHACELSPHKLARSGSSTRMVGCDPLLDTARDDSGSNLTHGTDIVFAGNVTSALRRRRSETESISPQELELLRGENGGSQRGLERPKTPARMSITDTLDRASELDTQKYKSRDAIMNELRAWQLETAFGSHIGVINPESDTPSSRSPAKSPSKAMRRPNTSAGVLRNGINIREAFGEASTGVNGGGRAKSAAVSSKKRASFSTRSGAKVDILILDHNESNEPSTKEISAFNVTDRSDWNLDALSPRLHGKQDGGVSSKWSKGNAGCFVPPSNRASNPQERMARTLSKVDSDDESSASDNEETTAAHGHSRIKLHPKKSQSFFNVTESLHAIDKWRDEMEDDEQIVSVNSVQPECLSPRNGNVENSSDAKRIERDPREQQLQIDSPLLGPANHLSDEEIIQLMKTKSKSIIETKTRDGFRRYFQGIEAGRLERILHQVFSDSEKIRRRLQLMQGFFRHNSARSGQ